MLAANYTSGSIAAFPVTPGGSGGLSPATDSKQAKPMLPLDPALADRQEGPHAHQIKLDPWTGKSGRGHERACARKSECLLVEVWVLLLQRVPYAQNLFNNHVSGWIYCAHGVHAQANGRSCPIWAWTKSLSTHTIGN